MDPPRLDHVSLVAAPSALVDLGFGLTPTQGSSTHSRIFLDRHYIEVDESGEAEIGAKGWFLGTDDLDRAAAALAADVAPTLWPTRYEGHDGTWRDVEIVGQSPATPVLTRRADLSADDWPPALGEPHPNGATTVAKLCLRASQPELLSS